MSEKINSPIKYPSGAERVNPYEESLDLERNRKFLSSRNKSEKPTPFIKHPDDPERVKPDEESLDLEYNKEFLSFIKKILSEAGINFSFYFNILLNKDSLHSKAYIGLSMALRNCMYYQGVNVIKRTDLDQDLSELFDRPRETEDELFFPSEDYFKDLNIRITKAYRDKVNIDVLLRYLDDPSLDQAKKNILIILLQIMDPECIPGEDGEVDVPELPYSRDIDACPNAETHLLAYISGEHINPRMGHMNIITDEHGEAVMLEKKGLGESYSCVTLVPIRLDGKLIPAGAILESKPRNSNYSKKKLNYGMYKKGPFDYVVNMSEYEGFRFVRFNLISLSEDIRARAGGDYHTKQWRARGYINYDWVTPDIIRRQAKFCIEKYPFIRKFLPF